MSEPFGPFREGLEEAERVAQSRCLRTLVHVHGHADDLERMLLLLETDRGFAETGLRLLDMLPARTRREILATFAYIHRPRYSPRRKPSRKQPKGTAHDQMDREDAGLR